MAPGLLSRLFEAVTCVAPRRKARAAIGPYEQLEHVLPPAPPPRAAPLTSLVGRLVLLVAGLLIMLPALEPLFGAPPFDALLPWGIGGVWRSCMALLGAIFHFDLSSAIGSLSHQVGSSWSYLRESTADEACDAGLLLPGLAAPSRLAGALNVACLLWVLVGAAIGERARHSHAHTASPHT